MKKLLGIFSMFGLLILAGCGQTPNTDTSSEVATDTTPAMEETTTESNVDKMDDMNDMEKDMDDMMEKEKMDDMDDMKNMNSYLPYTDGALELALKGDKKVVLFVHNRGCGSCNLLDGNIKKDLADLPEDMVVLNIDYATQKDVMEKYNIDGYHTIVYLDAEGKEISRNKGTTFTITDIVNGQ